MFFKNRSFFKKRAGTTAVAGEAYRVFLYLSLVLLSVTATAKVADTADKVRIYILHNKFVNYYKTDTGEFYHFIGDVAMQQGTDTLFCDSLYENYTTKIFQAFSNVRISQQDGTQATSDYLKYTQATKMAFMQGNVTLKDGANHLKCQELTYNLDTKTGVYDKGGTLSNDTTTVTSNAGIYNVRNKEARFTGHAVITDPQYTIKSEDVIYNTETKVTRFFAKSVVTSDSGRSVLETSRGTYDSKNVIAHFVGRSSIWNDGQYMEADTIHYNKLTGYGFADGKVISIDTQRHSTLYCGHTEYFRKKGIIWATIKPVLKQVNGKDTLYMRADTFYSAHMVRFKAKKVTTPSIWTQIKNDSVIDNFVAAADSLRPQRQHWIRKTPKTDFMPVASPVELVAYSAKDTVKARKDTKAKKETEQVGWIVPEYKYRMPDFKYDTAKTIGELYKNTKPKKGAEKTIIPDSMAADTTAPIYFVGYHHVRIFSDSVQGKCDSVCYTRSDSTIRMITAPIVWSHKSQITGDTILLHLDSSQIRSMYVPNNAFVVSQSGPEKAKLFDQVQGKTLTAYFVDNTVTRMIVFPNAESIYYSKDDKGAYLGVNQSKSERMRIFFEDQKISSLKLEQEVHQTMTPLYKADLPNTKLSRFKWLMDQRPKTKEELFQ